MMNINKLFSYDIHHLKSPLNDDYTILFYKSSISTSRYIDYIYKYLNDFGSPYDMFLFLKIKKIQPSFSIHSRNDFSVIRFGFRNLLEHLVFIFQIKFNLTYCFYKKFQNFGLYHELAHTSRHQTTTILPSYLRELHADIFSILILLNSLSYKDFCNFCKGYLNFRRLNKISCKYVYSYDCSEKTISYILKNYDYFKKLDFNNLQDIDDISFSKANLIYKNGAL